MVPAFKVGLDIQSHARKVGITKAYHLWLAFGGSKSTASSLWRGYIDSIQFATIEKLMTILKISNPGGLFSVEELEIGEENAEKSKKARRSIPKTRKSERTTSKRVGS